MAYAMVSPIAQANGNLIGAAAAVLLGYSRVCRLAPVETMQLRTLVAARLCASIVLGAYSCEHDASSNKEYLSVHSAPALKALQLLWRGASEIHTKALWEKACLAVALPVLLQQRSQPQEQSPASRKRTSSALSGSNGDEPEPDDDDA